MPTFIKQTIEAALELVMAGVWATETKIRR